MPVVARGAAEVRPHDRRQTVKDRLADQGMADGDLIQVRQAGK